MAQREVPREHEIRFRRREFLRIGGLAAGALLFGTPRIHPLREGALRRSALSWGDLAAATDGEPFRGIRSVRQATPVIEGAGVRLRRAFGHGQEGSFDPFLLFDDFRNDRPEDYLAGFPWHPHRGIETITYVLAGRVDHSDSLGNRGSLRAGDVQWMTAGSGILHQEMPAGDPEGRMHGFQLWANLPASLKMTDPRYQDIASAHVPEVTDDDGTRVRVLCGSFWGKTGPVDGIAAAPSYLDVTVPPLRQRTIPVGSARNAFAYVFEGSGSFGDASPPRSVKTETVGVPEAASAAGTGEIGNRSLVEFDDGDAIRVRAGEEGIRFLLVSGRAIREPIAWRGPIVMNTDAEIERAYRELEAGTFIRHE
jgi:redox-sensitive bicupin YhaK (pirin superfamily)